MHSALNTLHLVDETHEVSLWIMSSEDGRYYYEIVARKFEAERFDEEIMGDDELFDDAQSAVAVGVPRAVAVYQSGSGAA